MVDAALVEAIGVYVIMPLVSLGIIWMMLRDHDR